MIVINARFLTQPITGVQRFAIELSKRIKKELAGSIVFVSPINVIHNELAEELDVLKIGSKTGHLWEQYELVKYLVQHDSPLLINFCNTGPLFYKNSIVTIHDIAFEKFPGTYQKKFLYFYRFLVPRIARKAQLVITVSEFSKKEIISTYHLPQDKIVVVYNAVSDLFKRKTDEFGAEFPFFLAVSSFNQRKNLPLVLKAFKMVYSKNKSLSLYLIGDSGTDQFYEINFLEYKNHPGIHFTGRVSDEELINYYSNAICFIYPSFYEGFGIPPLEAQKCGTPVIVSSESCLPEIYNESVLYCNAYEVESLVKNMELILMNSDVRNDLILKGFENSIKYSWDKSSLQVINIINRFIKK